MQTANRYCWVTVVMALLLLASFLLPIHIHPFRMYYHEALMFVLVFAGLLAIAVRGRVALVFPVLLWFPLALFFFTGFQTLALGVAWSQLIFPWFYFLGFSLALILGANWHVLLGQAKFDLAQLNRLFAFVYLSAGVISVGMQLTQIAGLYLVPGVMYFPPSPTALMRPFANLAQPNQLALLLCFSLASAVYLHRIGRMPGWLSVLATLLLIVGLALTQSRIAWIILPAFAGFLAASVYRSIWARVLLCLFLLFYFFLVWLQPYVSEALGFAPVSALARAGGRSERSGLWQQAWAIAQAHPWLGVGWFGFGAEQVKIAGDFASTTYAEHAHNWVLNFFAELGFPFSLVFFSALLWWLGQTIFVQRRWKNQDVAFALMGLIAVTVHSLVEFPLWYANVLIPLGIWMGALHRDRWGGRSWDLRPGLVSGVAAIGLLGMALVHWDYQRVVRGFEAFAREPIWAHIHAHEIAKPVWTLHPAYFDYFQVMCMEVSSEMSASDLALLESMSLRFGFVHVLNKLAEAYAYRGEREKAIRTMITLQRLHPLRYPEFFDYWQQLAKTHVAFAPLASQIPPRDAP